MPDKFTNEDAKRLINEHRAISKALLSGEAAPLNYKEAIQKNAKKIILDELLKELEKIPVEELNRDKKGFRIKTLKDSGYNTLRDIAVTGEHILSNVNGISEEAARSIKSVTSNIINELRKSVRVRISSDNRSSNMSSLIKSIAQYRMSLALSETCRDLLMQAEDVIVGAVNDLAVAVSKIKWFFASSEKKDRAIRAYDLLRDYLVCDYGQNANRVLAGTTEYEELTVDEAWAMFDAEPVRFLNILENFVPEFLGSADDDTYGLPKELFEQISMEEPFFDGLLCELRPYQLWGVKYILHQGNVLLGDEMGLGKTVQAIAAMVSLKNSGQSHFAVVCPASVLANWCREIRKHSMLDVIKVYGEERNEALQSWKEKGGVAVTTYETTQHFVLEEDFKFALLTVDEAHYIKNPDAKRTKNVRRISANAERLLFMTGTPLENNVDEMVNLIEMLNSQIAKEIYGIRSLARAEQFKNKVAGVYYRRKREDVLTELPELIESEEWCELGFAEKMLYEESVLSKHFQMARRVSWQVDDLKDSSKAARMAEIIAEAKEEGRKIIVFSFFLETIEKIYKHFSDCCTEPITGSVDASKRQMIIDEFDNSAAGTVLLAQIIAGGTGLNIQSASVVIICEPQLKPSIENQAISRAYRMGQTRNVLVFRLLCENTVDERITDILNEKQKIFDAFADESVAADESAEINEKQMSDILNKEILRITKEREGFIGNKSEAENTTETE